ncbi:FAD-dependent oxidoreductase [Brevibacterium picturae]
MSDDADVLIVGAGAVGLTLAVDLQRRGVKFRIIDAASQGFEGSRAKAVQPRTLEVFDDLGVSSRAACSTRHWASISDRCPSVAR